MFGFLSGKVSQALTWIRGKNTLTESDVMHILTSFEEAFLEADVPLDVTNHFLDMVKIRALETKESEKVGAQDHISAITYKVLTELLLGGSDGASKIDISEPGIIMMMGLQGAGKTTTIAKLSKLFMQSRDKKAKILATSVDFSRPAAIDQLKGLAKQVGFDFFEPVDSNAEVTAKRAVESFNNGSYTHLFVDTPGRLHVDSKLMEELRELHSTLSPKYSLLVLDAMTGQESLNVANAFDQFVGISGAILSKMDSDARGGAAIAFASKIKKPILFVGTGEKDDEIEPFVPQRVASRIMGEGDFQTLAERVERTISQEQRESQEGAMRRFMSGNLTLEDFALQMSTVTSMGSLGKLMRYMPGAASVSREQIEQGETEIKCFKAAIGSMTPKERRIPGILNTPRKRRIAKGAGISVADIERLLQKFEESKRFAKMLKSMGGLGGLMSKRP
ncbi:signal recognition particle protein [Candidatus Dependentiae bacterium]